jgi:hypothetical protein
LVGSSSNTSSLLCCHAPRSSIFFTSAFVRRPILLFERDEALIRGFRCSTIDFLSPRVGKFTSKACSALNISEERSKSNSLYEDILAVGEGSDHGRMNESQYGL